MALPLVPLITAVAPKVIGAITGAASRTDTLKKDDFLKLLVAQLKNQDPLSPLSNDQFIQQSTAFSSLEQLQNISKGVDALGASNGAALSGAASLLGRPVTATQARFTFAGSPVALPYTLAGPAGAATLEVVDSTGAVVGRQTLGAQAAGPHTAVFAPSSVMAAGEYSYRIVSMEGGRSTTLPAIAGTVSGITLSGGQPVLQVGPVAISLANVTSIGTPTN